MVTMLQRKNTAQALKLSLALGASALAFAAQAADITGAGATFPYPIYAKWADMYRQQTGIGLNYQSIGSGGGIKQIKAKTVDFGASDKPLPASELQESGLVQFPAIIGGVVPVFKLEGIKPGALKLSGALLADIYLGKVKKWNDAAIAKLNANVKLPNLDITPVYRSDGSGTTFLFTHYLSEVSADFKAQVGEGTSVKFPAGVGGKGNEGVASYVQRLEGSIGYVEYAYAKQNKLSHTSLSNKAGQFTQPSEASFKQAAANADWKNAPGMEVILTNQAGANAWPITGASFILMHKKQDKPQNAAAVLQFFDWTFSKGDKAASELDYVPLPNELVALIRSVWQEQILSGNGKPVLAH